MELIALKQKSHPSQSESRNKRTTIDLSNQSESDSELYCEDSVERVKELGSEFPQEEVYIFNVPIIEVILVSTIQLMCFYVTYWNQE